MFVVLGVKLNSFSSSTLRELSGAKNPTCSHMLTIDSGMICSFLYHLLVKPKMGNPAPQNENYDWKNRMDDENEDDNNILIP